MVYMMCINAKSARNGQEVGDIVGVFDYANGPTATEQELFDIVPVKKIKKQEIDDDFQSELVEGKDYPKFPFSIKKITAAEKSELDKSATPVSEIRRIIKKIKPKKPVIASIQ